MFTAWCQGCGCAEHGLGYAGSIAFFAIHSRDCGAIHVRIVDERAVADQAELVVAEAERIVREHV